MNIKKYILDQKGFTLIELLAVITILALIMSIGVFSFSGVTENYKKNVMKNSALAFSEGLSKLLLIDNNLKVGDYYVSPKVLEKDVPSPWGKYVYKTPMTVNYMFVDPSTPLTCGTTGSFIRVTKDSNGNYIYSVCLYDDQHNYIFGSESVLLKDANKSDYYLNDTSINAVYLKEGMISKTA